MRRLFYACLLFACVALLPASGAVRGDQAMYVGGSMTSIPEKTEGKLDLADTAAMVFTAKTSKFAIPYKGITSIEYGQKAGRRVGVALAVSPVALFSKKRKHYVSIAFQDEQGNKQGAVFELAKGVVHTVISNLETRTGKKIEFESDEAKKHYEKEAK